MKLVDYPDDSESESQNQPKRPCVKRSGQEQHRAPPPLPDSVHRLYATESRLSQSDDPALHDGRVRQTPHTAGIWPSHVYVECMCQVMRSQSRDLQNLEKMRGSFARCRNNYSMWRLCVHEVHRAFDSVFLLR